MIARTLLVIAVLAGAASAEAQTTRAGKSEFYLAPTFTASRNYSFEGGSTAHSDTGTGLTLGFAHHFDEKKSLGVETAWGSTDYRASVQPGAGNTNLAGNINATMQTWTVRFVGTYNFLAGNLTPFVTGGLGWTYIDTNIPTGLPQNVCWYYPWYGRSLRPVLAAPTPHQFHY